MRIIIVDTTIHEDQIGGAHTFLPRLIKGLNEKGYEIHLVTKGIPNKRVAKSILDSGAILHTNLWNTDSFVEETAPVFANWVNKIKPDVYLISASADIGWVVLPYLDPQIATLTIGHTDSETFYLPARHYFPFLTMAIGVSNEVCDQYISSCNLSAEKIDWIPYGVEGSSSLPLIDNKGDLEIVFVGRIEEKQKRISDLIKIVNELSGRKIKYHLKIIGDGPEMPKLKVGLTDEISEGKVHLYGWLNSNEVIKLLRESEVFILTSVYEGLCISLIEAMANGCCPVVTDIRSGNKQMIKEGQSGFLIEIGRVDLFVEKIKWLLENPSDLLTIRNNALKEGQQYTVERMVEQYAESFIKAIAEVKRFPRQPDIKFPLMSTCRSKYPFWLRSLKVFAKKIKA